MPNDYQLPYGVVYAVTITAIVLLIAASWFNTNLQLADLRGDVKVAQTQIDDLSNRVSALTQRIQDLVDKFDAPTRSRK